MGAANDFLNLFFKQYPEAAAGNLDMEELNRLMTEFQNKMNNSQLDDFDGISPAQMSVLLQDPFSANAVLRFSKTLDKHLDQVPLFKLAELLLIEIRNAGKIKLTAKGNLPVSVCELLYGQELIEWEYMQYTKKICEDNMPFIGPLKHYLLDQGIVKKQHNTLSLTKAGEKFMQEDKMIRFISLFLFFGKRFRWDNFYRLQDEGKCGQLGWAFSLLLLSKYGNEARDNQFYSLKVMQAFEKKLWDTHRSGSQEISLVDYHRAYTVRFFECFANWFGLVNIERKKGYQFFGQIVVTKTPLFDQLFESVADK